ncbi:hypothetical protein MMC24_006815 [Lignoscripta atroalba]|nr:hypothetical protein [Lignoscripta atroalba]
MGSSSSKAAKTAAGAVKRQYPQRVPPQNTNASSMPRPPAGQASAPGPTVHPKTHASSTRDEAISPNSKNPSLNLLFLHPAINLDAADPDFARSLRSLGPVTPNPMLSNSSTFNAAQQSQSQSQPHSQSQSQSHPHQGPPGAPQPSYPNQYPNPSTNPALQVLTARSALADEAEAEFAQTGRRGAEGRRFLDVVLIRQALMLRDEQGMREEEIERRLGLKKGVIRRLGAKGVVGDAGMGGDVGMGGL